ncbi:hypothetical protein FE784_34460 [Paenibacillus hemerocallicola]|uniref:Heparin-sulfate lyase N-terminal domain-containing protein n=1 Tax=Paenibacillus hemerocallicola TaxID=1172614 RepID=A0A5C4SY97_9BACL|nr:hypothetical protein [Paenibacillus hemerocallicola]TNJ61377.1 hypothetical protein FE784_34460 [Paenibacillus hemerocallicola]
MEKTIDSYGLDYFTRLLDGDIPFQNCIGLRACGALALLIAQGRKREWLDIWIRLMDRSCDEMMNGRNGENDLAVKDMMLAFKLMHNRVEPAISASWRRKLQSIEPYETYASIYSKEHHYTRVNNMTVYNMAGEYLRETEGMTDTTDYFDVHWPIILDRFDEQGMYRDPDLAMLYDLSTRVQASQMLWFGYKGKYAGLLDTNLVKGGLMTLFMQSSAFLLPYGGRSNHFLFNEALVAACCEYEAARYMKMGDPKTAGMFKRCAHLSAQAVNRWLDQDGSNYHIKNHFPNDSGHGTEVYATFHRYMIPLANFIGHAFIFADESIDEFPCPAELGGYVLTTSDSFHKVFANCRSHSIEIDTMADGSYDSTGMGRYHRTDVPIELGLSMPFTATPRYKLAEGLQSKNLSLGAGWEAANGHIMHVSDLSGETGVSFRIIEQTRDTVSFSVEYSKVKETYTLDKDGVNVELELVEADKNKIYYTVPLLESNGKDTTLITRGDGLVTVNMGAFCYTVRSDGQIEVAQSSFSNKNGIYKVAMLSKDDTRLSIRLNLAKDGLKTGVPQC